MAHIYCLTDPNTGEIRYIGKTEKTIEKRLREHLKAKTNHFSKNQPKYKWMRSLGKKRPFIILLATVPDADAYYWESFYYECFRGCNRLLNASGQIYKNRRK